MSWQAKFSLSRCESIGTPFVVPPLGEIERKQFRLKPNTVHWNRKRYEMSSCQKRQSTYFAERILTYFFIGLEGFAPGFRFALVRSAALVFGVALGFGLENFEFPEV